MHILILNLWNEEKGQDIAEYAVMVTVILLIVVSTLRLIGRTPRRCSRKWPAQSDKPFRAARAPVRTRGNYFRACWM